MTENPTNSPPKSFEDSIIGGPKALGDPEDRELHIFEKIYGIPAKKREIIFREHYPGVNEGYLYCLKQYPIGQYFFKCRSLGIFRKLCIAKHWDDPKLHERAVEEYIRHRNEVRKTGIVKKQDYETKGKKFCEKFQKAAPVSSLKLWFQLILLTLTPDKNGTLSNQKDDKP